MAETMIMANLGKLALLWIAMAQTMIMADLRGFYSIRINNQWRIVFRWQASQAREVRIVDYH